ncbi:MAG: hypothetical protein ACJA0V_003203, partial [Planctomycetota bacterium]
QRLVANGDWLAGLLLSRAEHFRAVDNDAKLILQRRPAPNFGQKAAFQQEGIEHVIGGIQLAGRFQAMGV